MKLLELIERKLLKHTSFSLVLISNKTINKNEIWAKQVMISPWVRKMQFVEQPTSCGIVVLSIAEN